MPKYFSLGGKIKEPMFFKLPAETHKECLSKFLKSNDFSKLTKTCKNFYKLYNNPLVYIRVQQLLKHVILGEQKEVIKIIKINPELIFLKGNAKDYSGRNISNVSAFQLAWGAYDSRMLYAIFPYAKLVLNFRKKLLSQIDERFAEEKNIESIVYDYTNLINAITALNHSKVNQEYLAFRSYFLQNENQQGYHFNIKNLSRAYEAFYNKFDRWSIQKRTFFWVNVIGYLQRMIPANYAQAYCSSFDYFKEIFYLDRKLTLLNGDFYYDGLGSEKAIYTYYQAMRKNTSSSTPPESKGYLQANRNALIKYHEQNKYYLSVFYRFLQNGEWPWPKNNNKIICAIL